MSNCPAHSWEPFDALHNRCRNCGALVSSAAGDELSRLREANDWARGKASQLSDANRELRAAIERKDRALREARGIITEIIESAPGLIANDPVFIRSRACRAAIDAALGNVREGS